MADQPWQDSVAEIWQLFKETAARFKETEARFKETEARFRETDARFKETDARFKETDRKINQLSGLFSSQWGKLIEALVEPNALRLFQERGIRVQHIYQRAKSQLNGQMMELDLLLENQGEVIVLEVKSTLRVSDVNDFLADMARFLDFFPRYRDYRVYAGVAGLDIVEGVDRYAYRQGLFVLGVVGDGVVQIKNDLDFKPRDFAASEA
ncbi:MAG: DUF3782 domain-containing protein [Anaerolineae bacterium]